MSWCERCWSDAHVMYADGQGAWDSLIDAYHHLLIERKDNPCTPEQQNGTAGPTVELMRQMGFNPHADGWVDRFGDA